MGRILYFVLPIALTDAINGANMAMLCQFGLGIRGKMSGKLKYVVFRTKWGYFGLLGTEKGLFRSCLPANNRRITEKFLLSGIEKASYDEMLAVAVQERIIAYFNGSYVNFQDVRLDLDNYSEFSRKILLLCKKIRYGKTKSYSGLAKLAHNPKAARAVGNVLGRDQLPLIIPCHRVIRSDGKIGGFSANGGEDIKKRMLDLEQKSQI